ncbi:ABC transporter ATP-binding protein [Testudinibacter sp. P27/CKL/0425]
MNHNKIIEIQQLGFYYRPTEWLFNNLTFQLKKSEILAILGPNGCGKSTLLDILLTIHRPQVGTIKSQCSFGFVPQFFTPNFSYSVLDIVLMGRVKHIRTFSVPSARDKQIALQALDDLGLVSLAHHNFSLLSGGQKQLILIARAIATECQTMLLDEPTSALDLHNQDTVLSLLYRLSRERQLTIIFTTHQPNHASAIADKTLLMNPNSPLFGCTKTILSIENLSRLFKIKMLKEQIAYQKNTFDTIIPLYKTLLQDSQESNDYETVNYL